MRALVQIFLLMILVACASPFRTVYTSAEGDYYIEERAAESGYYIPDSVMYADIGFDPWWITANPSLAFIYYNPNYYRYYLLAWHRLVYQPYYGYYRGYYPYWCPPYRVRDPHIPANPGMIADNSMPPPIITGREMVDGRDLWRTTGSQRPSRPFKHANVPAYRGGELNRSTTSFMKTSAKPSMAAPGIDFNRSSGFDLNRPSGIAGSSSRSVSVGGNTKMSSSSAARDKH